MLAPQKNTGQKHQQTTQTAPKPDGFSLPKSAGGSHLLQCLTNKEGGFLFLGLLPGFFQFSSLVLGSCEKLTMSYTSKKVGHHTWLHFAAGVCWLLVLVGRFGWLVVSYPTILHTLCCSFPTTFYRLEALLVGLFDALPILLEIRSVEVVTSERGPLWEKWVVWLDSQQKHPNKTLNTLKKTWYFQGFYGSSWIAVYHQKVIKTTLAQICAYFFWDVLEHLLS